MRPWMIVPTLLAAGCGSLSRIDLTCREPDVEVWTAEGEQAALCDITFMACEDGSILMISCTNDTFSGDYSCSWIRIVGSDSDAGDFESADICRLDPSAMIDEINAQSDLEITVE